MTSVTTTRSIRAATLVLLLLACTSLSRIACAETVAAGNTAAAMPAFVVNGDVRTQAAGIEDGDLGTDGHSGAGTVAAEGELDVTANFNPNALFFWQGRAVGSGGHGGFQTEDTGGISNGKSFLEWRQSYFEFNNIDQQPLTFRVGRQKMHEPYGLWWNQDFDAGRLLYQSSLFSANITAGQNLFDYNTNGSTFTNNDRDVARVMGEASWQYWYENFLEARAMYQDDHSAVHVGQIEDPQNLDFGTSSLTWLGLRAAGRTHVIGAPDQKLAYRVDLLTVGGHEDLASTAAAGSNRVVTGIAGHDVRGWAFDASTDIPIPNAKPLIHLGYAYGSGDGNTATGTDNTFRQPGLFGNFSRFGALTENTDNYGTVLRPQLSNIHIVSAGVTMPVFAASDVGAIYRYYRLADAATSLPSSGIENNLDGVDKYLGQGIDLLFNTDILKDADLTPTKGVSDVSLRSSLGFFWAGKAYGTGQGDMAARGLVEVRVGF